MGSGKKIKRLILDPELTDGYSFVIHDKPDGELLRLLKTWMDESPPGHAVVIELVEMTESESEELPGILHGRN